MSDDASALVAGSGEDCPTMDQAIGALQKRRSGSLIELECPPAKYSNRVQDVLAISLAAAGAACGAGESSKSGAAGGFHEAERLGAAGLRGEIANEVMALEISGCTGRPRRSREAGLAQVTKSRSASLRTMSSEGGSGPPRSAQSTPSSTRSAG